MAVLHRFPKSKKQKANLWTTTNNNRWRDHDSSALHLAPRVRRHPS